MNAQPGDQVTFTPHPHWQRPATVKGILREAITSTTGAVGWHILAPLPGDPTRIVRVWAEDGTLTKQE